MHFRTLVLNTCWKQSGKTCEEYQWLRIIVIIKCLKCIMTKLAKKLLFSSASTATCSTFLACRCRMASLVRLLWFSFVKRFLFCSWMKKLCHNWLSKQNILTPESPRTCYSQFVSLFFSSKSDEESAPNLWDRLLLRRHRYWWVSKWTL